MSVLRLNGSTSGYSELTAPAVAGDQTFTLPGTGGELTTTNGGQTIEHAAGSASAPSVTFTGDTNTGIFSTGADTVGVTTGGSERLRITSGGNVLIGTTSLGSAGPLNAVRTGTAGRVCNLFSTVSGDVGQPALYVAKFDNNSTTSQTFVVFTINNDGAGSGQINANGANQAAFGTYSDARLKTNINDLGSQWNNFKKLRPVEFNYIESEGGGHQIGFIAQEIQEVFPDLVSTGANDMLSLSGMGKNESRLIKALQEAMERIETLEASNAALESRLAALEAN